MAATAIELMTLFGVKDSNTEQENLSHFISISNSQHGEDLRLLVRKYWDNASASDAALFMKGILTLMWANVKDIGEKIMLLLLADIATHFCHRSRREFNLNGS